MIKFIIRALLSRDPVSVDITTNEHYFNATLVRRRSK